MRRQSTDGVLKHPPVTSQCRDATSHRDQVESIGKGFRSLGLPPTSTRSRQVCAGWEGEDDKRRALDQQIPGI